MENKEKNAKRFMGFANIYEKARPSVPEYPVRIISLYLGKNRILLLISDAEPGFLL